MNEAMKSPGADESPNPHFDVRLPQYSRWRRMQIPIIAGAVYAVLRLLGPTLRIEILGEQHANAIYARRERIIWAFWHNSIIGITWWARNRGIVVLNSTNFDGQWTKRVIERFGFGTVPGSSTRGGLRGIAALSQKLAHGADA